jgi:phosphoribosylformylglycinamidine synthase PurS subunit
MARVVVDVMLKPEILDPQGQAIQGALPTLGVIGITSVRQGKHFEIEVDGEVDEDALGRIRELAGTLLANPVIEDFTVRVQA